MEKIKLKTKVSKKPVLKRIFETSEQQNDYMFDLTDGKVLLSFSCGKDSIAAWLELRDRGFEIIPFYCYLIPGLEFVEESLAYYEEYFGQKIIQVPLPALYKMLSAKELVLQPPQNCAILERLNLPNFTNEQLETFLREDMDLPDSCYVATGVRAVDSPNRWATVKKYGSVNHTKKKFHAVYDWRIDRLRECLEQNKIKLSVDYQMFGRSFDGIDYRFLAPIKKYFPADYERILEFFPLAELEIKRFEFARKRGKSL